MAPSPRDLVAPSGNTIGPDLRSLGGAKAEVPADGEDSGMCLTPDVASNGSRRVLSSKKSKKLKRHG
ncbi:hypothetical protein E4U41_000132 [Claviceps citrina]|nr:hypothetical protein E4U41_000132 [Claviceps citrina]